VLKGENCFNHVAKLVKNLTVNETGAAQVFLPVFRIAIAPWLASR
jgi:hypothetical protein